MSRKERGAIAAQVSTAPHGVRMTPTRHLYGVYDDLVSLCPSERLLARHIHTYHVPRGRAD
jgi:hypothetical protein